MNTLAKAKNYLNNIRFVRTSTGVSSISQQNDYYPFGMLFASNTNPEAQPYKHIGKEFDPMHGLNQYDFHARQHDPAIGRFMSIDPHCERYYWISPYVYCANNPLKFIDPDGKDIYRFDDKTGDFHLAIKNDDKSDQVGKFKYDKKSGEYTLQTNKKGEAKTRMDNIEKGILKDGINFKENDNVIAVGGEGQPSVQGVENFVVGLSDMVDKEIAGYEYSMKGESDISNIFVKKYKDSTAKRANGGFNARAAGVMPNQIDIYVDFHTHLSRFPDSDRLRPSGIYTPGGDMDYKRNQKSNGIKKFTILTKGYPPIEY